MHGRPATLFPTFAVYGVSLILAPRLLKSGAGEPSSEEQSG